jgi:serine/threonine protein kinase
MARSVIASIWRSFLSALRRISFAYLLSSRSTTTSDPEPVLFATRSFSSLLPRFSILRLFHTKCREICFRSSNTNTDSISFGTLKFLAAGKSGAVYAVDDKRILKEYYERDGGVRGKVERRAYDRVGAHPNIARLLGVRKDGSILLERGEVLRKICRASSASEISLQTKLSWLRQAAGAYQYLHGCNILHCDVGCSNMILTREGCLKIIDLEGCSIDGEPADSCYEWFSYRPSLPRVSRRTEIFAFGCAIYEVVTGRPPHHELEKSSDRYEQVEELYTNQHFPDVTSIPLGRLIQSCWDGNFTSMSEVLQEMDAFHPYPIPELECRAAPIRTSDYNVIP